MSAPLDRRLFLASLIPGVHVLAAAAPLRAAAPPDSLGALERSPLSRLLPKESATVLGREYVACPSRSRSAGDALTRLREAVTRAEPAGGPYDDRAWRRALAEVVRSDFREGRTVSVGNWTLSETEAELCAMVARHTVSP